MKLTFVSVQRIVSRGSVMQPNGCFELVDLGPHLEYKFVCDQVPSRAQLDRILLLNWVYSVYQLGGLGLTVTVLPVSVPESMVSLTASDLCDVFARLMG